MRALDMGKILAFAGMLILAAGTSRTHGQTAGVIQFVAGDVQLVATDGSTRKARKGVPLSVGDTLATAGRALAQVKMGDGAIVVVQPESRLTVAEFHYAGREDGNERVRYRLEQGGFRAVTGAIGRTHKQNYLIETPVAHMGVRGTDHESYYFPPAGPAGAEDAKPGAYNKVNAGRTFMRTSAGEVEIEPNQVGFVASASQVPQILPRVPGFFNRSVAPRNARPAVNPDPAPTQTQVTSEVTDRPVEAASGELLTRASPQAAVVSATGGSLVAYVAAPGPGVAQSGSGLSIAANGATLTDAGSDASWGVRWGTWQGGLATVDGQGTLGSTHVIHSAQLTTTEQLAALPASVVRATYSHVGGPAPTDALGQQGAIKSLDVAVDFSRQMIDSYVLHASVAGMDWAAKGAGSIAQFTSLTGIALNGNCAGCVSPAATGSAHGAFVGAQAERMITTFGLSTADRSIAGAAFLAR